MRPVPFWLAFACVTLCGVSGAFQINRANHSADAALRACRDSLAVFANGPRATYSGAARMKELPGGGFVMIFRDESAWRFVTVDSVEWSR